MKIHQLVKNLKECKRIFKRIPKNPRKSQKNGQKSYKKSERITKNLIKSFEIPSNGQESSKESQRIPRMNGPKSFEVALSFPLAAMLALALSIIQINR